MSFTCDPRQWVGLGFVATIENAPGQVLTEIEGIYGVAAQIAWGLDPAKPDLMQAYLHNLADWDLLPVGWAWCDAEDIDGARAEGLAHARIAVDLGLGHFIANMEEPYDAHGDERHAKFHMPDAYCSAFRSILPDIHFAVTTTPRWASNHQALRDAGAVLMGQAFSGEQPAPESGATVAACCQFALGWGWTLDKVRPLVQVYETRGEVPDPGIYLQDSADYGVGVIPYILEQALGGQGRAALDALVPAITRLPMTLPNGGFDMEKIGKQHGITGFANWLRAQSDAPQRGASYDAENVDTWPWPDKIERTLSILAKNNDESAE